MMNCNFNKVHFIISYNVRSLKTELQFKNQDFDTLNIQYPITSSKKISKLELIKHYIYKLKPGIIGLNETWLTKDDETKIEIHGYQVLETRFPDRRGGVALIIHNSFQIEKTNIIEEGRCIHAKVCFENTSFNLFAIYAPNHPSERVDFWNKIAESSSQNENNAVMFGDFNQVENNLIDRSPPGKQHTTQETISITNLFNKFQLTDMGTNGDHTHTHSKGTSRIDRICASTSLSTVLSLTNKTLDLNISDHKPIHISLTGKKNGFSRFVAVEALVRKCDQPIFKAIKEVINSRIPKYEKILVIVRKCKLIYSLEQNKMRKDLNAQKKKEIEELDVMSNFIKNTLDEKDTSLQEEIDRVRSKIFDQIKTKTWNNIGISDGRRGNPNITFSNKIKPTFNQQINSVYTGNGNEITEKPQEIGEIYDRFYSNLYSYKEIDLNAANILLEKAKLPNIYECDLPDKDIWLDPLEKKFNKNGIVDQIKRLRNGTSPGPDGLTPAFYKKYNFLLSPLIASYANHCLERGSFDEEVTEGLIKPIPKKNSDSRDVKNIRPITLLNILYKIITGAFADKLGLLLPRIISDSQKAVRFRQIHHNHFTLDQICKYAKFEKKEIIATFIDTEKSFDLVSHNWIKMVMKEFGFGENCMKLISVCLQQNFSRILLPNGELSKGFNCYSGVKQGDPMSMMLFVLSIEPLIRAIENEPRIKGISPPKFPSPFTNKFSYINQNKRFKLFEGKVITKSLFFADDGTFFNTRDEIPVVREITNIYCNASGAKVNKNKSLVLILNRNKNLPPITDELPITEKVTYLGIDFDKNGPIEKQWKVIFEDMVKNATIIKKAKNLSTIGKSKMIKSYVLSLIYYQAPIVPISDKMVKKMENLVKWCLWSKSMTFDLNQKTKGSLSTDRMSLPKELSYLNLPNIKLRISSIKAKTIIEVQETLEKEVNIPQHLYWLEYIIHKDMEKNKRCIPIFAVRNQREMKWKKGDDKWIAQAHLTYKDLPRNNEQLPSVGDNVIIISKNGKKENKGKLEEITENSWKIKLSNKIFNCKKEKVYHEKFETSHLTFEWSYWGTGSLAKELYQNSKNRMIIKNRNDANINLLWKNCKEKLADDKSLFSSIGKVNFFTRGQQKCFEKFNIKTNTLSNSKTCRENIFSFHARIILNILPIYNKERKCKLCSEKISNGWHILLDCKAAERIQLDTLKELGYEERNAKQKILDRKNITQSGSANPVTQNCAWTLNWAIWKLYNAVSHEKIIPTQTLSEALRFFISMEEFRTFNFWRKSQMKDYKDEKKHWEKGALIYRFEGTQEPKIQISERVIENVLSGIG
eukprot:TRINITY_DN432_c0_g2_i4.p1 TRINITY_DN432_c0_g2~~TRINITY_DN432_c0_g2_i4.p1  ORF type:complete len:1320 (-),score=301.97 TRINITY_DN432_c0_g2_i4:116-4075(-)